MSSVNKKIGVGAKQWDQSGNWKRDILFLGLSSKDSRKTMLCVCNILVEF